MKSLKIATVFSGIGAFEQALEKRGIPYDIVFACDNGEREISKSYEDIQQYIKENDLNNEQITEYIKGLYSLKGKNWMKASYFANYKIDESKWYEDIRFIDGKPFKNKVDIFVGGSPCQSFSNMGKRLALEDTRGTLFFEYARLVKEIQPKVFIYENVPGMLKRDSGKTWETIQNIFKDLKYDLHIRVLNSINYGIPQKRERLFVIGFKQARSFEFPSYEELTTSMFDYLEENVDEKYYLGKKGFEFVTNEKYSNRASVNHSIIKTQKANQQYNWNGDFVFVEKKDLPKTKKFRDRAYIGEYNGKIGACRQLTPRECLRLMGFADSFKISVPDVHMWRQAGNSIVVNVLENIITSILEVGPFCTPISVATVFSGIGAAEFALKRLHIPHKIVFACDNGEREIDYNFDECYKAVTSLNGPVEKKEFVDQLYLSKTSSKNFVKQSYLANYPELDEKFYFQDIRLLDGRDFEGKVDLFIGGSPCQSFSSVGFQGGLEDARGTLFYDFARLVKEIKPKVFIYENVRNLVQHDKGKTWMVIQRTFESLGYHYFPAVLNAADYGIPQTRRRLFVVGFKDEYDFMFPEKIDLKYKMKDFTINQCKEGGFLSGEDGELEISNEPGIPDEKYTLTPLLYKYVMCPGTKNFYQKVEINKDIARTILKTMGNRHRAGVDNYLSFDGTIKQGSVRMLTEREALRLMGFTDDYKIVVSRAQTYKQAGNSIVVDVMMAILKSIFETGVFN